MYKVKLLLISNPKILITKYKIHKEVILVYIIINLELAQLNQVKFNLLQIKRL